MDPSADKTADLANLRRENRFLKIVTLLACAVGLVAVTVLITVQVMQPNKSTEEAKNLGKWETVAPMLTARTSAAAGVINGQLYVVGGGPPTGFATGSMEAYDPAAKTWAAKADAPMPRSAAGAGVIANRLYVVGGMINSDANHTTDALAVYDSATDTWKNKSPMPKPLFGVAVGVIDGKLYVAGGAWRPNFDAPFQFVNTLQVYDTATDTWTSKAPMPTKRGFAAAGVIGGRLYVVGGDTGVHVGAVEVYDPATDTWEKKHSLPTPRRGIVVGVINNILYAAGGVNGHKDLLAVDAYDPSTDIWSAQAPLSTAHYLPAGGVIAGKFYVAGSGSGNIAADRVEVYTPK